MTLYGHVRCMQYWDTCVLCNTYKPVLGLRPRIQPSPFLGLQQLLSSDTHASSPDLVPDLQAPPPSSAFGLAYDPSPKVPRPLRTQSPGSAFTFCLNAPRNHHRVPTAVSFLRIFEESLDIFLTTPGPQAGVSGRQRVSTHTPLVHTTRFL